MDETQVGPGDANLVEHIASKHGDRHDRLLDGLTSSSAVGQILLLDYDTATLAVHDFHKESVGGLARGMFLVAGPIPHGPDATLALLRVAGAKKLANHTSTDDARLTAARDTIGRELWSDSLTKWIADEIALGGVEARILGTLTFRAAEAPRFAEDIANYYSARGAFAWKPEGELLQRIVNLTHRGNHLDLTGLGIPTSAAVRVPVARTRFASADHVDPDNPSPVQVRVRIDPTDLLKRRTAFLGMSRSGKSNAMKITAQAVYLLRKAHPKLRIGQLIFDPNGEYAQDNPQDGRGLHRIHELVGREREGEVETYGMHAPETDKKRRITRINFFGNHIPVRDRTDHQKTEVALDQLLVGRMIIRDAMSAETARFTTNFRDADLAVPANLNDRGVATRYHRAVLVHKAALAAAGFEPPGQRAELTGLFSGALRSALRADMNEKSSHPGRYERASQILGQRDASWSSLGTAFAALDQFINDKKSAYEDFEEQYREQSSSGEDWADPRLQSVLSIFRTTNGVRTFQSVTDQHSPNTSSDYAEDIVADLRDGKLVIFDQSIGSPELNLGAADRIMWKVFNAQQAAFRSASASRNPWADHVLVYVEEAHNLLPRGGGRDVLSTVWARAAKEGGKMNLGMVLATQAPSSVLPEILSETDNWFISHLNSDAEARVVEGYQDFADFVPQIRRVSEPGFIRLRTLSAGYTVPVQLDRFRLDSPESDRAEGTP